MKYPVNITDIAVIGMTCRFPKAKNPAAYLENIKSGQRCTDTFDKESCSHLGIYEKGQASNYVPVSGVIDGIELFDAEFFGITPSEASLMDPQHRILLECAWEALESSGYITKNNGNSIGVYASCSRNTYILSNILQNEKVAATAGMYPLMIGSQNDFISTRISYKLGLTGPSLTLQTACSSSLVAVHYACQDLILQNCDISLVGASTIHTPHQAGYYYEESGILSKSGRCEPFQKDSSGPVPGNGAGVLVLKRLQEAIDDKDTIYAVIKGTKVNNDGNNKIGYTAPGINGQEKVIRECLRSANVKAEQISFVEAHGTGTKIGDPIELTALRKAFNTTKESYCAISSVKSQIGHLDATAGIAGLMKAILCLDARVIPPAPYLTELNPNINLDKSPFYFPVKQKEWINEPGEWRYAGVSSFGVGGTNSHAIVMEAPPVTKTGKSTTPHVFPFSAKNQQALNELLVAYRQWFINNPDADLQDVSYTLWCGRNHFKECRTFVTGNDVHEIINGLSAEIQPCTSKKKSNLYIDYAAYTPLQIIDKGKELMHAYPMFKKEFESVISATGLIHKEETADFISSTVNKDLVALVVLASFCRFMHAVGVKTIIADNGRLSNQLFHISAGLAEYKGLQRMIQTYTEKISSQELLFGVEHAIILSSAKQTPGDEGANEIINLFSGQHTVNAFLTAIGSLWSGGSAIQGQQLFNAKERGFIPLPTYAFQRKKYWIEPTRTNSNEKAEMKEPAVENKLSIDVILSAWKDILGVEDIKPENDFFELGGDSLSAIQFISRIKEIYQVTLNVDELLETTSAREVDDLLRSKMKHTGTEAGITLFSGNPFQQLRKGDHSTPLILFHPAGGTVFCYHELLRQMNITSDVYGIQFPLDMLNGDVKKVPELAAHYMTILKEQLPADAYYLGGYSLGGNIAFEMATLFQKENKVDVKGLFLIDSHAPAAYKGSIDSKEDLVSCFPFVLSSFLKLDYQSAEKLDDLEAIYLKLSSDNIMAKQIAFKDFKQLFNVWKYNHLSLRNYEHALKYNGDLVIFNAEEEEPLSFLDKLNITPVEKEEWAVYVNGNLEIIDVPGNHMTMLSHPHVQQLANAFNNSYNLINESIALLRA